MLLFQDCFPLLSSSLTKWDWVSATNENITFKPGSDQSGKLEQALHSAPQPAFKYHLWRTKEAGKELPCSLKRASKGQKATETFGSVAQLFYRVGFGHAWDLFPNATHSLVSLFHQAVSYPSRKATYPLSSSTSYRNPHETRKFPLAFVGSQVRWLKSFPKTAEQLSCLQLLS